MGQWDYDNEICRECPVRPLIDLTNEDVCDPCRVLVRLSLDIQSAIDAAQALVDAHSA